jgi:hypothetical protein
MLPAPIAFGDPAPVLCCSIGNTFLFLGEPAALELAAHFRGDIIAVHIFQYIVFI